MTIEFSTKVRADGSHAFEFVAEVTRHGELYLWLKLSGLKAQYVADNDRPSFRFRVYTSR